MISVFFFFLHFWVPRLCMVTMVTLDLGQRFRRPLPIQPMVRENSFVPWNTNVLSTVVLVGKRPKGGWKGLSVCFKWRRWICFLERIWKDNNFKHPCEPMSGGAHFSWTMMIGAQPFCLKELSCSTVGFGVELQQKKSSSFPVMTWARMNWAVKRGTLPSLKLTVRTWKWMVEN